MLRWGDSGKPPALLVHGTGFVTDVWDEVARELASTYTVYALDRRGHGASHIGDARGNPFTSLAAIDCPVRATTAAKSGPIYKEMASRAVSLIPFVSTLTFDGAGHCVAQEAPAAVVKAVCRFA